MELEARFLFTAVLLILTPSFHYQVSAVVDGWHPIKNLNSPVVLEIVRFAVSEHNKDGAKLQLMNVVQGDCQVVQGMNYKMIITATDAAAGNEPGNYEAVVLDKPFDHFRQLKSFTKL